MEKSRKESAGCQAKESGQSERLENVNTAEPVIQRPAAVEGAETDDSVRSAANDGDDYLRRMMANVMDPTRSQEQSSPSSAIGLIVKEERTSLSADTPVEINTGKASNDPVPAAQSSPSAAAARWAAKLSAGGNTGAGISFSPGSTPAGYKPSWRDDFVAAVQANKRKRKAAAAAVGKTKKKKKLKLGSNGKDVKGHPTSPSRVNQGRRMAAGFTPEELEAYKVPLRLGWRREFVYRKSQRKGSTADVYYVAPNGIRLRSLPEIDDYLRTASEKVTRSNFTFRRIIFGFDEIPGAEIVRGSLSPEFAKLGGSEKSSNAEQVPHADVGPASVVSPGKPKPDDSATGSLLVAAGETKTQLVGSGLPSDGSNKKGSKQKVQPLSFLNLQKDSAAPKWKPAAALSSNGDSSAPTLKRRLPSQSSVSASSASSRMQKLRKVAISESQRKRNVLLKVVGADTTSGCSPERQASTPPDIRNKARKSICPPRNGSSGSSSIRDDSDKSNEAIFMVATCSNDACQTRESRALSVPCITCLRLFHRECLPTKGKILPTLQFECNECIHFHVEESNGDDGADPFSDDAVEGSLMRHSRSTQGLGPVTLEIAAERPPTPLPTFSSVSTNSPVMAQSQPAALVNAPIVNVAGTPRMATPERERTVENNCASPPLDLAVYSNELDLTTVKIIINGSKQMQLVNHNETAPVAFPFDRYNDYVQALLTVFSYLPVRDLLQARLVCKAWNTLSNSPAIWKYAHLKGCRIRSADSWLQAVEFLKKRGVEHLDVSGCGHGYASMRQFIDSALPALSRFVQGFRFGQVLPKLLDSTAKVCGTNLRRITMTLAKDPLSSSEWISSAPFNSLISCRDLVELRLSAADSTGRRQRVYINGEGLPALASLTQLRVLALFDVRALDEKVFKFLDSLTCLRVLEIGDCQSWTRETYCKLRRLVHLRRLRLEYFEPGPAGDILAESLSAMQELREVDFIRYSFDYSYASTLAAQPLLALSALPHLHTLRLYPDLDGKWPAPTWRRTVDVLTHFAGLKRLELGITLEDTCSVPTAELDVSVTSKPPFMCTRPRQPQKIAYVNKEALNEWIADKLPNTVINLADGLSASDLAATREARWW